MIRTVSEKIKTIPDSLITEAVSWAAEYGALNLASGSPDFLTPDIVKQKAGEYIRRDHNQYTPAAGAMRLREALSEKLREYNKFDADPKGEITITCGTAEAMFLALFTIVSPGREVILFEPAFESYIPDVVMASGIPRIVRLEPPGWELDRRIIENAFNEKTAAIIINTPHNPTGKVFLRSELEFISELCSKWDAVAITDEIYEHITYDNCEHISMASIPGMEKRTISTGGFSKTYNCTGWRIGYCIAPGELTEAIRKVHTYLTVCAPAPLQDAAVHALSLPPEYYKELTSIYERNRDLLFSILKEAGFIPYKPQGSYFMMADFTAFGYGDDVEFAQFLAREIGVCAVPERAFCTTGSPPGKTLRFCFARKGEVLEDAGRRLGKLGR